MSQLLTFYYVGTSTYEIGPIYEAGRLVADYDKQYRLEISSNLPNTKYYLVYSSSTTLINVTADNIQLSKELSGKKLQFGEAYYLENQKTEFNIKNENYLLSYVVAMALDNIKCD